MVLDIYTLTTTLVILYFLQTIAISIQYFINRTYRGVSWWAISALMITISQVLYLIRAIESLEVIAIIFSNLIIISSTVFTYIGIIRFFERKPKTILVAPVFILFSVIFLYYILIEDNISVRIILFSSALAYYSLLTAACLLHNKTKSIEISANIISFSFLINSTFHVLRACLTLINPTGDDFFLPSRLQMSTYIVSIIFSTLWTYGIILMINQRLNAEINESKDRFEVIFNTGPDIALLTRLSDGKIFNVNEEFTNQIGYQRHEVIGKTTKEIELWSDNELRSTLANRLRGNEHIENYEGTMYCKDGHLMDISLSARVISLHGEPHIISVIRDITARKQAEKELQQSEKKYRTLIESANEIIVVIENDLIRLVNPAVTSTAGYKKEDLVEKPFLDFVHPQDRTMILERHNKQLAGEEVPPQYQFRLLTKDRGFRWIELSSVYIEWDEQPATLNFLTDISERKQIEEALKKSEALYRATLNASPDGFIFTQLDGTIQMVSPSVLSILRYEYEEIFPGKNFLNYIAPQDRELVEVSITQHLKGEASGLIEYCAIIADGSHINIESNSEIIRDENGQPTGMVFIIRDISARIEAQEALRQSEARFRLIAENTGDVIWVLDIENDRFRYLSPSVQKLRGYTADEVMATPVSESLTPESLEMVSRTMPERLHLYLKGIHETFTDEIAQPHKNGSIVWTETVTRFLPDDEGEGWVVLGVSRDITERKRLREELVRQATTDELTGIFNRRHFIEVANTEIKRSQRHHHPLSLAVLDIDHFKNINDTYGHAVGDIALVTLTKICKFNLREIDHFARLGGDEFVILLPETEQKKAFRAIERIHRALASHPMQFDHSPFYLQISSGIASLQGQDDTLDMMLGRADQALYHAKESGRNRISNNEQVFSYSSKKR